MPRLCAFGCRPSGASMHRFPDPDKFPDRFKMWVSLVGGNLGNLSDYEYYKKERVCDLHFTDKDRNRCNRLNALAVPSLCLGVPLHCFPNPDTDTVRFQTWISNVGLDVLQFDNDTIRKKKRVCHKHFESIYHYTKNRLCRLATPVLQMPEILISELCCGKKRKEHDDHTYSQLIETNPLITEKEHSYCSTRNPKSSLPPESQLDSLPAREESFTPEPMECDVDDPLGSPRNKPVKLDMDDPLGSPRSDSPMPFSEDEDHDTDLTSHTTPSPKQSSLQPAVRRTVTTQQATTLSQYIQQTLLQPVPRRTDATQQATTPTQNIEQVLLQPAVRRNVATQQATTPSQNIEQVILQPAVRRNVATQQATTPSQNTEPSIKSPCVSKPKHLTPLTPTVSKREKQLLIRLQALKTEVKVLRKRVKQIDKITSPVLKSLIESSIHNQNKKANGQRWSAIHKSVAVNIYKRSPPTYHYFRKLMPMPTVKTVQKLIGDSVIQQETDDGDASRPVTNTSFRDIVVNQFDENTDLAVRTISLTTPQSVEEHMVKLRQHIKHLTSVVHKFQTQNKLLKERLGPTVKNNENLLNKVTENMTPAAKVFTKMQYTQTAKKPGARRYTPEEKVLTVSMYNSSPTGYAALCNFFTLPTENLIQKFSREVAAGLTRSLETIGDNQMEVAERSYIHGTMGENNSNIHSTMGENNSNIHSTMGENNSNIHSTMGENSNVHSTMGENSNIHNTMGENSNIHSTMGENSNVRSTIGKNSNVRSTIGKNSNVRSTMGKNVKRRAKKRVGGKERAIRLPPPPHLTAAPSYGDIVNTEIIEHYVPTVHSTVDVSSEDNVNIVYNYQRNLDMALSGLTVDMPGLD